MVKKWMDKIYKILSFSENSKLIIIKCCNQEINLKLMDEIEESKLQAGEGGQVIVFLSSVDEGKDAESIRFLSYHKDVDQIKTFSSEQDFNIKINDISNIYKYIYTNIETKCHGRDN